MRRCGSCFWTCYLDGDPFCGLSGGWLRARYDRECMATQELLQQAKEMMDMVADDLAESKEQTRIFADKLLVREGNSWITKRKQISAGDLGVSPGASVFLYKPCVDPSAQTLSGVGTYDGNVITLFPEYTLLNKYTSWGDFCGESLIPNEDVIAVSSIHHLGIRVVDNHVELYSEGAQGMNELRNSVVQKKEVVLCQRCNAEFPVDSEDFYAFYGNVCIGLCGGVIGNNLDEDDRVVRVIIYCKDCAKKVMNLA